MRFLIIHTYNPDFIAWLYSKYENLPKEDYKKQLMFHTTIEPFFIADFYSSNLKKLGCEAFDIIANSPILQKQWVKENYFSIANRLFIPKEFFSSPILYNDREKKRFYKILFAQIKKIKPDIIINPGMEYIDPDFIAEIKPYVKLMVGQFPEPLAPKYFKPYDLYLSSLPNLVEKANALGIKSVFLKLGFEPGILSKLEDRKKNIKVSSISGFGYCFKERIPLFEKICKKFPMDMWGYGIDNVPKQSPIRDHFHGSKWGIDMYQAIKNSKIIVNKHADSDHVGDFANNLRLYETTGVGTLLLTDWKENLPFIFEPGKEVVVYKDNNECLELIDHYLDNEEEHRAISGAGQKRTLNEHTYYNRMEELRKVVKRCI